jgi:hypothetical protein
MATLTELEIEEVSLVDAGANPESHIVLYKRKDDVVEEVVKEESSAVSAEDVGAAPVIEAPEVKVTSGANDEGADEGDVQMRKRLDAYEAETIALKKQLAELRESAERKEAYSKAAVFNAVPGAGSEELSAMIYEAGALPVAAYETLMNVLSATQKAMGTLLVPKGQEVQAFEGGSAEEKIESLVKSVQQREGIPRPQAMAKVCADNPDLYRQFRTDKRKQVKG